METKCDCVDCGFRGMESCVHRTLMEENARLKDENKTLRVLVDGLLDKASAEDSNG